jgi:hypothetical protein
MMAQRQKERDSIRAVKKAEFEERRQRLIEEREQRRDSLMNARQNRNKPEGTKEGEEGEEGDGQ